MDGALLDGDGETGSEAALTQEAGAVGHGDDLQKTSKDEELTGSRAVSVL